MKKIIVGAVFLSIAILILTGYGNKHLVYKNSDKQNINAPYDLTKAKKDKDLIIIVGGNPNTQKIYNYSTIERFINNFKHKKSDNIRIIQYYQDKNYLLVDKINDLNYNGKDINFIEYDCKSDPKVKYIRMPSTKYSYIDINKTDNVNHIFLTNNTSKIKIMIFHDYEILHSNP